MPVQCFARTFGHETFTSFQHQAKFISKIRQRRYRFLVNFALRQRVEKYSGPS